MLYYCMWCLQLYVVLLNVMFISICCITACDVYSCSLYYCIMSRWFYRLSHCPSTILLYMSKFVIDLLPWTLLFSIHIFKKPSVYFIAILNTKYLKKKNNMHLCSLLCKLLLNVLLYWYCDSVVSKHKKVKGNFAPIL